MQVPGVFERDLSFAARFPHAEERPKARASRCGSKYCALDACCHRCDDKPGLHTQTSATRYQ